MKVNDWLRQATTILESAGISTARLDCLVLLEDETGKDRTWLLAHPEFELTSNWRTVLDEKIKRRSKHSPLAFIRGKTEFYGREFLINENVLEPRPESETMIDLLKKFKPTTILDVGTGSGALAISAKFEFPSAKVYACDIDEKCLEVAKLNTKKHKFELILYSDDLLENLPTTEVGLIILANLPYVPDDFKLNQAAMNEPSIAIFGGPDGLDLYRRLFSQAKSLRSAKIFCESLPFQHETLMGIARDFGFGQIDEADFIQVFQN